MPRWKACKKYTVDGRGWKTPRRWRRGAGAVSRLGVVQRDKDPGLVLPAGLHFRDGFTHDFGGRLPGRGPVLANISLPEPVSSREWNRMSRSRNRGTSPATPASRMAWAMSTSSLRSSAGALAAASSAAAGSTAVRSSASITWPEGSVPLAIRRPRCSTTWWRRLVGIAASIVACTGIPRGTGAVAAGNHKLFRTRGIPARGPYFRAVRGTA